MHLGSSILLITSHLSLHVLVAHVLVKRLVDATATASVSAVHAAGTSSLLARAASQAASKLQHSTRDLIPHTRLSLLNTGRLALPETPLSRNLASMSTSWSSVAGVGIVSPRSSVGSRGWVAVLGCDERSLGCTVTSAWCASGVAAAETLH